MNGKRTFVTLALIGLLVLSITLASHPTFATLINPTPTFPPLAYLPVIEKQTTTAAFSDMQYGLFEDLGMTDTPDKYQAMITDLIPRGLDSVLFVNGSIEFDAPLLDVSDSRNFKTVFSIMGDLYRDWFYNGSVPVDLAAAEHIIGPYVDQMKVHPSITGYNLIDDAPPSLKEKMRLAVQIFRDHDPNRPASPMMVQGLQGVEVYDYVRPDVFLTYDYPARNLTQPCDFYGGHPQDFVDTLRNTTQLRPENVPLWIVLQTHNTTTGPNDTDPTALRTPTVEEVRLQNWLALGEEAKGIWWFIYSTQQTWIGLKDNPTLYAEVTDLAGRVNALRPILTIAHKLPDKFSVSGGGYASTLQNPHTRAMYVIVTNQSCSNQNLVVASDYLSGTLRDMETGLTHHLGEVISFRGGDGKLFEVVSPITLTPPTAQPNLVLNGSFETDSNRDGYPDNWPKVSNVSWDTAVAHTGNASLRIRGPESVTYIYQTPALKPDTRYYLSFWEKAQGLQESFAGMRYPEILPNPSSLVEIFWKQNGDYDWTKHLSFFKTPSDFTQGRLDIVWQLNSGATVWIDDIALCEANKPCVDNYLQERETVP